MFKRSLIVAAHPDDEVLWFSSILDTVDEVVLCYPEGTTGAAGGNGRKQSLLEHPMKNIRCLEAVSAGVFNTADWNNPATTRFGMTLSKRGATEGYEANYYKLKEQLRHRVRSYRNVFTHNPWGEYGHEEHVQVYRVIKELQETSGFNLWFSNYCSNRSFNLMLRHISGFDSDYVTLQTNKNLVDAIMSLYKKNNCWTWYDDWKCFNDESFMKDGNHDGQTGTYGHIFPLNMIKCAPPPEISRDSIPGNGIWRTLLHRIRKGHHTVSPATRPT